MGTLVSLPKKISPSLCAVFTRVKKVKAAFPQHLPTQPQPPHDLKPGDFMCWKGHWRKTALELHWKGLHQMLTTQILVLSDLARFLSTDQPGFSGFHHQELLSQLQNLMWLLHNQAPQRKSRGVEEAG
ncbi:uncharacterized protein AAG666_021060 isoform 2-T2 [Megaptera novaeangliae]